LSENIFSSLIGKSLKDEHNREIGRIVSFILDPSAEIKEVLVENRNGKLTSYPINKIKVTPQEGAYLISDIERQVENLCKNFPIIRKKRKILERLFKNKEIMPEIYESLSSEFDKSISEMKAEAQKLLDDIESQIQVQEETIKSLQSARAFLEMEYGVGNVGEEVFKQSLLSILREIKYASYRKMDLLKTKDKISNIVLQADKSSVVGSAGNNYSGQREVVSVRITNE